MEIRVPTDNGKPLYVRLHDEIRAQILSGALGQGARLPSTRRLAEELKISRTTVEEAYAFLAEDGLVHIRPGQGAFIGCAGISVEAAEQMRWEDKLTPAVLRIHQYRQQEGHIEHGPRGVISFTSLAPDHQSFAVDAFRKALNDVLVREGGVLLNYGYVRGYEPLRRYLHEYLSGKGVRMDGQQILIVDGFRQGLELTCRALVREGDLVLCENPTYNGAIGVLRTLGAQIIPIEMDEEGIAPEPLEQALRMKPRLLYTVPTYQNPTGLNMSVERRRQVVALCARYGVPIVEDGFNEELRFRGDAYPSLKAMDASGIVIYIGSFSKVLFPGLRVGWVVAPDALFTYLTDAKNNADIHTGLLQQAGLYEFLARGHLEKHLRFCRRIYRERMEALETALKRYFGDYVSFVPGQGGFCQWVAFPEGIRVRDYMDKALEKGVAFVPGDVFYPLGGGENRMRLGFSRLTPEKIDEGVRILAQVFER